MLAGKRLLITGVLTEHSIAYAVADLAIRAGAEVVLTGYGRGLAITTSMAQKLPAPCDVWELDVSKPEDVERTAQRLDDRWGAVDGVLHAIAYAPKSALGPRFVDAPWADVATTLHVSTYSFAAFGAAFGPLLAKSGGGSLVGLNFDAQLAWPGYGWMGVAKAGLESCCRYLATVLGPAGTRVNLVSPGPLRTIAARAIDGYSSFETAWHDRAPLAWDVTDATPAGRVVCSLFSDWMPAVTGEIIHVDGGMHAVGTGCTETIT